MCRISMLPENVTYKGVVVKEEFGHIFFTDFTEKGKRLSQIKKNLELSGAQIVDEILGDKRLIKEKILFLNKKANLPGVNFALSAD